MFLAEALSVPRRVLEAYLDRSCLSSQKTFTANAAPEKKQIKNTRIVSALVMVDVSPSQ